MQRNKWKIKSNNTYMYKLEYVEVGEKTILKRVSSNWII